MRWPHDIWYLDTFAATAYHCDRPTYRERLVKSVGLRGSDVLAIIACIHLWPHFVMGLYHAVDFVAVTCELLWHVTGVNLGYLITVNHTVRAVIPRGLAWNPPRSSHNTLVLLM